MVTGDGGDDDREGDLPSYLYYQRVTLNTLLPQAVSVVYEHGGGWYRESREQGATPRGGKRFCFLLGPAKQWDTAGPQGSRLQLEPNRDAGPCSVAGSMWKTKIL